ncbi:type II toxin-antitoxin system MqsR family toxin [Oryzibacter oryziterrae]|uniref:type II toxin-antitoxin system MqsR family toxin n=1 Tax=Oryzibacter oryziterrae TaxID=2766474 RepID=UPI001F3B42E4|nr:type II toxin-antitoxin system MqsR family toxin [Oryzibacter oryziterrae]
MNDKRRPSFELDAFKKAASDGRMAITRVALLGAAGLGFDMNDIRSVISSMKPSHFYKSTTSNFDHRLWQDVYHVPTAVGLLYLKFTDDRLSEFRLLSFTAKE